MIDDLKKLWQTAFGDDERYVDFYFTRRYRPENTRVIYADGHVVSAAQFSPYTVSHSGRMLDGVYILGVCTFPDYRGRGYASALIRRILAEQYAAGAELAFLIPAEPYLFDVYGKYGFGRLFTVCEERVDTPPDGGYELIDASPREIFGFYDRFYRSLDSAVLKSYDDFVFAMDDVRACGGQITVCGQASEIRGFAAAEGDVVKELLCVDTQARNTLLSRLQYDRPTVITPGSGAAVKTIGMARVLRPAAFLEKTAKEPVAIRLTDPLIEQNTSVYTVRDGVSFSETGAFDISLDVSELPAYFMKSSYANLLLN